MGTNKTTETETKEQRELNLFGYSKSLERKANSNQERVSKPK